MQIMTRRKRPYVTVKNRTIPVADLCPRCNRYTVYKRTNIINPLTRNYAKVEICTGCVRRLDSCDCKRVDIPIFSNQGDQANLRKMIGGNPIFKFLPEGDGRIKDKRF